MEKDIEKATKGYNTKGPTPGEITILASSPLENTEKGISQEVMNDLRDCGFNACFATISVSYMSKTLEACKNSGVHLVWSNAIFSQRSDDWIKATLQEKVGEGGSIDSLTDAEKIAILKEAYSGPIKYWSQQYMTNEYLGGYNLKDEPTLEELNRKYDAANESIDDFIKSTGSYYSISNRYQMIMQYGNPEKIISVNLVGVPAIDFTGATTEKSYTDYLDAFATVAGAGNKPYLWSYDLYPIKEKNALLSGQYGVVSDNGKLTINYERFYKDLEIFLARAKANSGVFWTYVQSMVFAIGSTFYPKSLEAYLRFEIFSSLAMGAQGVVYWTYHQRSNTKTGTVLHLSALVDMNDRKTAAWYYAQKVNREVKHFNFVFFDAVCEARAHVGEIYPGCPILNYTLGPIGIRIEAEGKGVLASYLTKVIKENGVNVTHRYIVIVSHDVEDYQDIKIFFNPTTYVIKELTPLHSGDPYPDSIIDIPSTGLERTLIPGGYLIYEWNPPI